MVCHLPSLNVRLSCAYISTSASRALSAFESCHIATMPLITRINRITNGSTYAAIPSSPSSKQIRIVSHEFQHPNYALEFQYFVFYFQFPVHQNWVLERKYDLPVKAITNEIVAATKRIYTKVSSNYSMIFSNKDCSSSLSNSFGPFYSNLFAASASVKPL